MKSKNSCIKYQAYLMGKEAAKMRHLRPNNLLFKFRSGDEEYIRAFTAGFISQRRRMMKNKH